MSFSTSSLPKSNPAWIVLVLLIVVVGVLYYFFVMPQEDASLTGVAPVTPEFPVNVTTDWNKEIFANPLYTALGSPIPLPLTVEQKGNPAPFIERKR